MNLDPILLQSFCTSEVIESFKNTGEYLVTYTTINFGLLACFVASILQKLMVLKLKDNATV
jgi:hypothetical protein